MPFIDRLVFSSRHGGKLIESCEAENKGSGLGDRASGESQLCSYWLGNLDRIVEPCYTTLSLIEENKDKTYLRSARRTHKTVYVPRWSNSK